MIRRAFLLVPLVGALAAGCGGGAERTLTVVPLADREALLEAERDCAVDWSAPGWRALQPRPVLTEDLIVHGDPAVVIRCLLARNAILTYFLE